MSGIPGVLGRRRGLGLTVVIAAVLLCAAPALAQYKNPILVMASNGQSQTCRFTDFLSDNFAAPSGPSTLWRVDPTTGDSTQIGPIEDPNLYENLGGVPGDPTAGNLVIAQDVQKDPPTSPTPNGRDITLAVDPNERIVDVCGLAWARGELYGTATLEISGVHVLLLIDASTGGATVLGAVRADSGLLSGGQWTPDGPPEATLCHPQDLAYDPTIDELITVASCVFYWDPIEALREAAFVERSQIIRINIDQTRGNPLDPITTAATLPRSINQLPFNNLSATVEPSTGLVIGTTGFAYVEYDGLTNGLPGDYWTFPQNLFNYPGEGGWPLSPSTVALAFDASAPTETLYRAFIDGGGSHLETIRVHKQGPLPAGEPLTVAVDLVDVATSNPIIGAQAIAFGQFPDTQEIGVGSTPPDFTELIACSDTPRSDRTCRAATAHTGVKMKYEQQEQSLKLWANLGPQSFVSTFGQPDVDTNYAMCLYGPSGDPDARLRLIDGRQLPSGPPWIRKSYGVKYRDESPYTWTAMRERSDGVAKVKWKGKAVGFPALPLDAETVQIQIINSLGECWSARFSPCTYASNTSSEFKGRYWPGAGSGMSSPEQGCKR